MNEKDIKQVTQAEAAGIIERGTPRGLFYQEHNGIYIGIDNSTGDAWVEEFENLNKCKDWLNRLEETGDQSDEVSDKAKEFGQTAENIYSLLNESEKNAIMALFKHAIDRNKKELDIT